MKKVFGMIFLAMALTACGGGSGSDSNSEGSSSENNNSGGTVIKVEAQGLYTGSTNQGQSVIGLVDKNNKFWFLYSPPYRSGVTGFIAGNLNISNSTVSSSNGKDFYFGGAAVYDTSLTGTVRSKDSLKGSISYTPSNQVTFDTMYDVTMNKTVADLASIAGSFNGNSAIVQGVESANLTITSAGMVSGSSQGGCAYTGKITAETNTPYYTLNLVFGNSPCYMAGQEVKGVAYYDQEYKTIYAVAENNNRQNAVLFLGTKQ